MSRFSWDPEEWRKVTSRQQGLYRSTMALALCEAPRDFHKAGPLTAESIESAKVDDHHVFPRAYLQSVGRGADPDTVLNHVLIGRETNMRIGKRPPSDYLKEIRSSLGSSLFNAVLTSQQLSFEEDGPLFNDDFDGFLDWRLDRLAGLLSARTGGGVARAARPVPPHLHALSDRIEKIEVALRALVRERLESVGAEPPPRIVDKVRERFLAAGHKQPGMAGQPFAVLEQMQFFDLRDLEATITTKSLWSHFADPFGAKGALSWRFGQLAELRNAIRQSREVTPVIRSDGEAAIEWFDGALSAAASSGKLEG